MLPSEWACTLHPSDNKGKGIGQRTAKQEALKRLFEAPINSLKKNKHPKIGVLKVDAEF